MKPTWYSSYEENNYGDFFYALMRIYQPEKVVELGTEAGYSAYHMARGLKANGKGHLFCYDLWEKYDAQKYGFYAVSKSTTEENLKEFSTFISLNLEDALGISEQFAGIDILHVDLHNEGEILEAVIPRWIDKVKQLIIMEGGSIERDREGWMTKFNRQPIGKWLEDFSRKRTDVEYFTIEPFPSITIIRRKQ